MCVVWRFKGFLTSIRSASPTRMNSLRKCSRKSKSSGVRTMVLINWTQATFIVFSNEKILIMNDLKECVSDNIWVIGW